MSNTNSSEEYAKRLLKKVEDIRYVKEAQKNKEEEILNTFNILNMIIRNAVSKNGLSEFITLAEKKGHLELSKFPFQSSPNFTIDIDYLEASCEEIELTFFDKKMFKGLQKPFVLQFIVSPEKSADYLSIVNSYVNEKKDYVPSLNEQYTFKYIEETTEWTLNIYDYNSRKFNTPAEIVTTDSIMRIFYSAFNSVLK